MTRDNEIVILIVAFGLHVRILVGCDWLCQWFMQCPSQNIEIRVFFPYMHIHGVSGARDQRYCGVQPGVQAFVLHAFIVTGTDGLRWLQKSWENISTGLFLRCCMHGL